MLDCLLERVGMGRPATRLLEAGLPLVLQVLGLLPQLLELSSEPPVLFAVGFHCSSERGDRQDPRRDVDRAVPRDGLQAGLDLWSGPAVHELLQLRFGIPEAPEESLRALESSEVTQALADLIHAGSVAPGVACARFDERPGEPPESPGLHELSRHPA